MSSKRQLVIRRDREMWQEEDEEEKAKDAEIFAENMNRGASLLFQDSLVLFLQLLQVRINHVLTVVLKTILNSVALSQFTIEPSSQTIDRRHSIKVPQISKL